MSDAESPLLANEHEDYWEVVMTPDGKGIVYQIDTAGADLMYRRLTGDTAATPIANSQFNETMARVSPDGHWITYVSAESGRDQVMVQPFPELAARGLRFRSPVDESPSGRLTVSVSFTAMIRI